MTKTTKALIRRGLWYLNVQNTGNYLFVYSCICLFVERSRIITLALDLTLYVSFGIGKEYS
jgi:hypothetical protein